MEHYATFPFSSERDVKLAKITQAILEWYDGWKHWQRKILITGIVNRYDKFQLHSVLLAVESVFHKDFRSSVRKVYEVTKKDPSAKTVVKTENIFKLPKKTRSVKKNPSKQKDDVPRSTTNVLSETGRISSPRIKVIRTRTTSGSESDTSHPLSPIEEDTITQPSSLTQTAHLSHLITETQSPSTLAASLSPIEEIGQESFSSGSTNAPNSDCNTSEIGSRIDSANTSLGNKATDFGRSIKSPTTLNITPTDSRANLTPLGVESSLTLDFLSGITCISVCAEDFFDDNNPILGEGTGKPVTTNSMVLAKIQKEYDSKRNLAPIPALRQLYKRKKFWNKNTVKTEVDRLKEQFREQLTHIWKWIDDWPASKRTRLLMILFSKSDAKVVHYAAECLRQKTKDADVLPPPIEKLSDKLLLRIFKYLTPHDLSICSYVCKHWYHLLSSDDIWMQRCNMLGQAYNIQDLTKLLASGAKDNQALDWRQAYIEVEDYMVNNMKIAEGGYSQSFFASEEEEEDEDDEALSVESETENKFQDYIPYWKSHFMGETKRSSRKSSARKRSPKSTKGKIGPGGPVKFEGMDGDGVENAVPQSKSGFLEIWKNITEDLKEDLDMGDAHSDSCFAVDMFPDIQSWDDVGQLASIGQNFAVDHHVCDAIQACSKFWPIQDHVYRISKVEVLRGHYGTVNVVRPQGSRIFSGGTDRTIRVWDKDGECFAKMTQGLKGGINDIFLGGGNSVLFTASWDMSVKVWNSVTFEPRDTLTGHKGSVQKVAADSKFIVSCSHDGTIRIWNRASLRCENTLTYHNGSVQCMIYVDWHIISGGIDKKIHVCNSLSGRLVRTYEGHTSPVTAIKKQHQLLVSGDMEGNLYYWTLRNNDSGPINKIRGHESQIQAICMHGRTFFTASSDALVKEWDLVTLTTLRICQGHTDAVMDVQWTDKYLVTASRDNTIRRWWWETTHDDEEDNEEVL